MTAASIRRCPLASRPLGSLLLVLAWLAAPSVFGAKHPWIRAGIDTNAPMWGLAGGLQFALHPSGFTGGAGGPRGLIRLGYPTLTNGGYDLINFIAVEPIVRGVRGFSELEPSAADSRPGKRFWVGSETAPNVNETPTDPGELTPLPNGHEQLSVSVFIEPFQNGACVRLKLTQRSDAPGELQLTVDPQAGSVPIDSCILTATMGNKARARLLMLQDGPVSSLQLYPDYRDAGFAPHRIFPADQLPRTPNGDLLVGIMNDELDPSSVQPFGHPGGWDYRGFKVIQYWRQPAAAISPQLVCAVNARFTYWMSRQPIPGGIAFENFELREPFRPGQTFTFGIARPSLQPR